MTVSECRGQYMRERLRRAMKRLLNSDVSNAAAAARWVNRWGAAIGEQYFA